MTMRRLALVPLLPLALALTALPAAAEPFYLDLNAPVAGVSQWAMGGLLPDGELAVHASVVDLRSDAKWEPGFEIMLTGGKGYISLRTSFAKGGAQTTRPRVVVWNDGAVVSDTPLGVDVQKGQPVEMTVRWHADHTVDVQVAGASIQPVQVPFTIQDVRLRATTIDVKLENVRLK
jgi:hypothetical protein